MSFILICCCCCVGLVGCVQIDHFSLFLSSFRPHTRAHTHSLSLSQSSFVHFNFSLLNESILCCNMACEYITIWWLLAFALFDLKSIIYFFPVRSPAQSQFFVRLGMFELYGYFFCHFQNMSISLVVCVYISISLGLALCVVRVSHSVFSCSSLSPLYIDYPLQVGKKENVFFDTKLITFHS